MKSLKNLILPIVVLIVFFIVACERREKPAISASQNSPKLAGKAVLAANPIQLAEKFYSSKPEILRPRNYQKTPRGLTDIRAESCGKCHVEIYNEWKLSTHARAWLDDAQYQEELKKHKNHHSRDTSWVCVNCHTPLINQLPNLVVGLEEGDLGKPIYKANPKYDEKLQLEAITCATCHVKDGHIIGVYGNTSAPHPVKVDPQLQSESLCLRCHQAEAQFADGLVSCVFSTGREWKASPYSKSGQTCQHCHMPAKNRAIAQGQYPKRLTRVHYFGGSMIPKRPKDQAGIDKMKQHYKEGLTVSVRGPEDKIEVNSVVAVEVSLTNANAGHMLPTGDAERYFLTRITVKNQSGEVVFQDSKRVGTVYQWSPLKKISDNRIAPKEKRIQKFKFAPTDVTSLNFEVEVVKRRISQKNFDYHELAGRAVAGYTMFKKKWSVTVER